MINKIIRWIKDLFHKIGKKNKDERVHEFSSLTISDYLPLDIEDGIIYYSKRYKIAKFMCPNNCGNETVLTIGDEVDIQNLIWKIEITNNKATFYNSVGSQSTCGAHYFIRNNKVEWLEPYF